MSGTFKASIGLSILPLLLGIFLLTSNCDNRGETSDPSATSEADMLDMKYVGRESCRECHEREYTLFQGSDHDLAAGSITFAAGQVSESVSFNVVNDDLDEAEETLVITLGTPVNARLGALSSQTVTLIDNDPPPVIELTAAGQTVPENVGAVAVTAGLSTVSGREITVPYTVSGTADSGIDHNFAAGTITVAAGQTSGTAGFSVVDDSLPEADETVIVTLGIPTNASAGTVTVQTITIEDNDIPTVQAVSSNYPGRLNAVADFQLTIRFSSSMDTSLEPIIAMISSGSAQPVAPGGGSSTPREPQSRCSQRGRRSSPVGWMREAVA